MATQGGRILHLLTLHMGSKSVRSPTKCVVVAIDDEQKAKEKGLPLLGYSTLDELSSSDEVLCVGVLSKEQIQNLGVKDGQARGFLVGELPGP